MAQPTSKQELAEYCLRALGAPVINIEVEGSQISDRIDQALDHFTLYHADGFMEVMRFITFTARDEIDKTVNLPDDISAVLELYEGKGFGQSSGEEFERLSFLLAQSDVWNILRPGGTRDLGSYHMTLEYLALMRRYFNPGRSYKYNELTGKLSIPGALIREGYGMWIRAYVKIDANSGNFSRIWSDPWVKKYSLALIKRQWGSNLKKYDGVLMTGGISVNGQVIYDEAALEIEKLEAEFRNVTELPIDVFWG
jgi:hypothetical protein